MLWRAALVRRSTIPFTSDFLRGLAATRRESDGTAYLAPPSSGVVATSSDRTTAPIGLGPRAACGVAILRRRSISIPPAPFFSRTSTERIHL
jgi:hypothetical protein